jgi:hypothetical protein
MPSPSQNSDPFNLFLFCVLIARLAVRSVWTRFISPVLCSLLYNLHFGVGIDLNFEVKTKLDLIRITNKYTKREN